jgi:hypothetical protein
VSVRIVLRLLVDNKQHRLKINCIIQLKACYLLRQTKSCYTFCSGYHDMARFCFGLQIKIKLSLLLKIPNKKTLCDLVSRCPNNF